MTSSQLNPFGWDLIFLRAVFSRLVCRAIKIAHTAVGKPYKQGGKRLGDETSVSEQKGVMQWTGIELGARPKFKIQRSKFKILIIY